MGIIYAKCTPLANRSIENIEWKKVKPDEDGRFNCLVCSKTYSRIDTVKKHYNKVHVMGDKFTCEVCEKCFSDENCMKKHIKTTHIGNAKVHHEKVHIKENRFTCQLCNKSFHFEDALKGHIRDNFM